MSELLTANQAVAQLYGRDYLLNLLEAFIKSATAGIEVEITVEASQVAVTRYAHNRIHQNVWQANHKVWVRVLVNGTLAVVAANSLEPVVVKQAIEQAVTIARLARAGQTTPNPLKNFAVSSLDSGVNVETGAEGLVIPSSPQHGQAFFSSTLNQTPDQRAAAINQMVEVFKEAGFEGYGTYKNSVTELAVVNSRGLRAYTIATEGYIKALVERGAIEENDALGSGYADQLSRDVTQLDPLAIAHSAVQKCRLNVNQIELPPGDYAAVLEPNTVADMMRFVVLSGCSAQQLQDGRSFMAGRFGELVTGSNINLWEDPAHPQAMPFDLDYEGMQSRAVPLLIGGKAAGVTYDQQSASKVAGRISTGHAPDPELNWDGPVPTHVVMSAGTSSTEELIRGMSRGVVVTRLHYTHCPDPKLVVATGTTRDGTFLVENGEIVAAVKNMRFTQSVLELLAGVEEFGQAKTCQDWWAANGMATNFYYLPALRVVRCTFTGATTF
jgi:predicted Zn-dependent protease